ncbi:MAG TPA: hypothetical protein VIK95_12740, partial [Egibacteraceae bacterium]
CGRTAAARRPRPGRLDNVVITPHVANPPSALRPALAERVSDNVARFAAGDALLGVIDVERGC